MLDAASPRWRDLEPFLKPRPVHRNPTQRRLGRCLSVDDLERAARRRVPSAVWDYVYGGSDGELVDGAQPARPSIGSSSADRVRPGCRAGRGDHDTRPPCRRAHRPGATGYTRLSHHSGERAVAAGARAPACRTRSRRTRRPRSPMSRRPRPAGATGPALPDEGPGGQHRAPRRGGRAGLRGDRPDDGHHGDRPQAQGQAQRVRHPAAAERAHPAGLARHPGWVATSQHRAAALRHLPRGVDLRRAGGCPTSSASKRSGPPTSAG